MSYPYTLTLKAALKFDPCLGAKHRLPLILPKRRKIDAAKARELGCTYDDIVWIASRIAERDESLARRLTGYLNDNAKAVLHIFERERPGDWRVRACIVATDGLLAGEVSETDWQRAAAAADAACAAADADFAAANAAACAADAAFAADAAARATDAAAYAAFYAAGAGCGYAFRQWQFDRLIYWLTEEHPQALPMPEKGVPALPEIAKLERAS